MLLVLGLPNLGTIDHHMVISFLIVFAKCWFIKIIIIKNKNYDKDDAMWVRKLSFDCRSN